ncbi:hypothetical protein ACIBQ1_30960 [Nonomuraea sp. NPDC050153]|uniref:hypothetical protein n=1 Tax=Nonomuraea sp. NPDC050153 TaxID=3364359 RepID=UPI0037A8C02E
MADINDLLRELNGYLSGVTTSYGSSSAPWDVYEGYIFALIVAEALDCGGTVRYETVQGQRTTRLVFRTNPGQIYSTTHAYTHAVITFGQVAPPLEVHIGVQVQGNSGVVHECDVLVLEKDEADLCRSGRVAPRSKSCALAMECKFYTTSHLSLGLARGFQGLVSDLASNARPTFVANISTPSVRRYFGHKNRHWEDEAVPGSRSIPNLRSKIRDAFKFYLSKYDPRFPI